MPPWVRNTPESFWARVAKTESCWLWTGACVTGGAGTTRWQSRKVATRRLAWFLTHGAWPRGRLISRCRVPNCVRPDHHFEELNQRTDPITAPACPVGHPWSPSEQAGKSCPMCAQERRQERRLGPLWRPPGTVIIY